MLSVCEYPLCLFLVFFFEMSVVYCSFVGVEVTNPLTCVWRLERSNKRLVTGVRRRKGAVNFMVVTRMLHGWVAVGLDMTVTTQRLVLLSYGACG